MLCSLIFPSSISVLSLVLFFLRVLSARRSFRRLVSLYETSPIFIDDPTAWLLVHGACATVALTVAELAVIATLPLQVRTTNSTMKASKSTAATVVRVAVSDQPNIASCLSPCYRSCNLQVQVAPAK